MGYENWLKTRGEWHAGEWKGTINSRMPKSVGPKIDADGKVFSSQERAKKRAEQQLEDLDIDAVMGSLRNNEVFAQPVNLAAMVQILCVLWEDED